MVLTPSHLTYDSPNQLSPLPIPERDTSHQGSSTSRAASLDRGRENHLSSSTESYFSLRSASAGPSHSPAPPRLRKTSTSSFSKLSEFSLEAPLLDEKDRYAPEADGKGNVHSNGVSGVRHIPLSVDASEWRHPVFKQKVLGILRRLRVPLWSSTLLTPSSIHLQKVSGALTNAVFFVSFNPAPNPTSPSESPLLTPTMPATDPSHPPPLTPDQYPPTLLFRVYGPSSDALISREEELRILYVLSTEYHFGPKVYGTFANGRVEQFFPSRALTAEELRVPAVSRAIARRMRELHSVDLRLLGFEMGRDTEPTVWTSLVQWATAAQEVLTALAGLGGKWETWVESYGLHRVQVEVEKYRAFVEGSPGKGKGVVFAHNDTQYGNLLRLDAELPPHVPDHQRYIVIDFEYGSPNPRGYDIANHFHEWRANYHHPTLPHTLQAHFPYPTLEQRQDFYRAYLSIELDHEVEVIHRRKDVGSDRVDGLEREVRVWSPACSLFWSLWGVITAEEHVGALVEQKQDYKVEFDNLSYALERMQMFRKEARELGVDL
ncbi:choline kinase [Kwoniella heveanensis CBS 569]|uniref:Choline kinase n=1 Tax=Kwoniella heveanensis BCC8398 TaxID=1296120 RepID=A0A1B9GT25_9TREE|nr:choline kinase [Kwoniella heveanensis BCC8398]OCF44402.1 choline kinase [Kwoniella heveanensis CBS 569]